MFRKPNPDFGGLSYTFRGEIPGYNVFQARGKIKGLGDDERIVFALSGNGINGNRYVDPNLGYYLLPVKIGIKNRINRIYDAINCGKNIIHNLNELAVKSGKVIGANGDSPLRNSQFRALVIDNCINYKVVK